MLALKNLCDSYLLRYKRFFGPKVPTKSLKKAVLNVVFGRLLQGNGDYDVPETNLKRISWSSGLRNEAECQTLRWVRKIGADFLNMKKRPFFGILTERGLHEFFFWKAQNLEWLESVIFCVEWRTDHNAGVEKSLRFLFVEFKHLFV